MSRYDGINIKNDSTGKRYLKGTRYPDIPATDNDLYFISVYGDSLDIIAYDYYKNADEYWIIAIANGLRCDSRFIPVGTQVRVPQDITSIKAEFNRINGVL